MLDHLVKHKGESVLSADLKILIDKYDFHGSTSSVSLNGLKHKGLAENVGPRFVARNAESTLKEAHKARPKDTNGAAEAIQEINPMATNGKEATAHCDYTARTASQTKTL